MSEREPERPTEAGRGVEELRRRALTLGFAVVSLAVFILLLVIYWQLAHPVLWAATLAVLFYPLHRRFVTWLRGRERLGAVVSTIVALAIIFIPSIFIIVHLAAEARNLWPAVRDSLRPGAMEDAARWIESSRLRGLAHLLLGGDPSGGAAALQEKLQAAALAVQDFLLERMRIVTRNVPGAVIEMGLTIFSFFFFLMNGPAWARSLQRALPLEPSHAERLLDLAGQTISVVFRGVLLTAAAQATAAGLGYWAAGAPVPVLLSVATFVAALIPVVGSASVWVPTAVGLFVAGHQQAAVGLAVYGTFFVSLLDNFLRPFLIGRRMKLPLLWLFLAIIGGLKLFGFLGVVFGPMVLALALALYRIYQEGWRDGGRDASFRVARREPEDPV
jgi:predicted PurR-regulated permease PerM